MFDPDVLRGRVAQLDLFLLVVQTDLIVASNWTQIERVARALMERRNLSGDEVIEIVGA